jgi:Tfp pilus assembly protein PilF
VLRALPRGAHGGAPAEAGASRAAALCALALFFGFLFPYSHLLDIGALAAERFLFAPSLGFVLLLALAGRSLLGSRLHDPARRFAAAMLVVALVAAGSGRSLTRAPEWRDPVRLWLAAERNLAGDVRVPSNLAAVYLDRGELESAHEALSRALEIEPGYLPALGNLGALQIQQGSLDEARETFRGIVALDPTDVLAWYNLGIIEAQRGDHAAAIALYSRALELDPNFAWARRNRALSQRLATDTDARPGRPDQGPR